MRNATRLRRLLAGVVAILGSITLGAAACQPPPGPPPPSYTLLSLGAGDTTGANKVGNGDVLSAAISADGNEVAFLTFSTNVIPGDNQAGLFLRDRTTGQVTRLVGPGLNVGQFEFGPSADGRFVSYVTSSPFTNEAWVTVYDTTDGTTQTFGREHGSSITPVVSADGSSLIFGVHSAPDEAYPRCEVVDLTTGASTECDLGGNDRVADGISAISSNGRFVVNRWRSADDSADGLAVWDRTTGTVTDHPGSYDQVLAVSDDGRFLSIHDSSGAGQVDLRTATVNRPPTNAGVGTYPTATSRDGKYIHLATPATGTTGALTGRWNTGSGHLEDLGSINGGVYSSAPICGITLVTDGGGVCVTTTDAFDPIDDNAKNDAYLID